MLPAEERDIWVATFDDPEEAAATTAVLDAVADTEYEPDTEDTHLPFVYPH